MSDPFLSEDQVKANITYRQLFTKLYPYGKKNGKIFLAAIFSVLALSALGRALPFLFGYAIDHGIRAQNMQVLYTVAVAYLCCEILKTTFQFLSNYLFQKFGNRLLFNVREDLIRHIQSLPMSYFNKNPVGRIITRLTNDVSNLGDLFTDGVVAVAIEFLALCAIVISMALISVKLTLATLFLTPVFLWASYKISEKIRTILRESKKKLSTINSYVAENLNGIKIVQLYNRTQKNRQTFQTLSQEYKTLTTDSIKAYALMQPIMNLFNAMTISLALYFGGILSFDQGLAIGSLVAFIMHVQDFIPPLREILEKYQQYQNSLTSAERIFHIFDEAPENFPAVSAAQGRLRGDIEIKNLSFRYDEHLPLVLENISLQIQAGQSVALVGRTGSGKSTFISLLQKFYPAPLQTLFVDGRPIESYSREEIRTRIGVVQQDGFVFRGPLRDNITLGNKTISEEKIRWACDKVGYSELLAQSGRNLDFFVEERGSNLSVGEKQLISFARILAFEPDILILDEATANIDSQSEKLIQHATEEVTKDRTSIIIAHRLSTIENCDVIVVLDHGRIVEKGSHRELLAKKGLYAQMIQSAASHHPGSNAEPEILK